MVQVEQHSSQHSVSSEFVRMAGPTASRLNQHVSMPTTGCHCCDSTATDQLLVGLCIYRSTSCEADNCMLVRACDREHCGGCAAQGGATTPIAQSRTCRALILNQAVVFPPSQGVTSLPWHPASVAQYCLSNAGSEPPAVQ